MVMKVSTPLFTQADYEKLPEGFPAQLIRGELVKEPAPVPYHQALVQDLYERLEQTAGRERVLFSPVDTFLDEHNVFQPDLLVLPEGARISPGDRRVPLPVLVVEVLSPSTAGKDRREKREEYLAAGVSEVWLVDPDSRSVTLWDRSGSRTVRDDERLRSTILPGFELSPAGVFYP